MSSTPEADRPTEADWSEHLRMALGRLAERADTELAPGLGPVELDALDRAAGVPLPTEVRVLLGLAVPLTAAGHPPRWYDWRSDPSESIEPFAATIRDGVVFDVRHNAFWSPAWGPAPERIEDRVRRCEEAFPTLPRVFPLYGHRGIVADPPPGADRSDGNPVFSFMQTDVIYYGYDLADWLDREFGVPRPGWSATAPRRVPFWSGLAEDA